MKKTKFEIFFRSWLIFCAVLLLWSIWANAQDTAPATNTVATVAETEGKGGILSLPIALEEKGFLSFGLDRIPFLQKPLWEHPRWQYLASLIYIILAFYVSKFFDWVIRERLKKWAGKTETKFDDLLIALVHGPIKVVSFVILLHVGLEVFSWPVWVQNFLSKGLKIIVAFSLTYVALKAVDMAMGLWRERTSAADDKAFDEQLFPILRQSLRVFVFVVAVLVTCQNLGLNITSVLALGSVAGLAVGLGAQDTLANLFGAIAIFVDKPFRIGDHIRLPDAEGKVETIGMRSTRVRNLDGHLIAIPNKTMANATITNVTRRPNLKTTMNIGITYDTSSDKVRRAISILEETYKSNPKTSDLIVSFNQFNDSALNIMVVHWYDSLDVKEHLAAMQELNLKLKERFDSEGINFAFPSRTLYIKQDSEWRVSSTQGAQEKTPRS